MPHFGLMDESTMSPEDAELLRARLHVRGGRRRLRQSKAHTAIAVYYDAFLAALRWYCASPERLAGIGLTDGDVYDYERRIYDALARVGLTEGGPDFDGFEELSERALDKDIASLDYQKTIDQLEHFLTRIGVMPFDEDALPPEESGAA